MLSELGSRPMLGNNENSFEDGFENEFGFLHRDQRRHDVEDRENDLNLYRSGSAPPTVEGSLSAVGGLFNHGGGGSAFSLNKSGNALMSEEEIRSDPTYLSYYYSNVNMNPRLPPPTVSREDWRFAQKLQGGGGGSAIGDQRKVNRSDSGSGGRSMPPGINSKKQEDDENEKEWGRNGLIGLPGLGNKQKSLAEIFQEDLNRSAPVSRPTSRNAFDESSIPMSNSSEASELTHHPRRELTKTSSVPIRSNTPNIQSPSYSYAPALGSRSSTPYPQRITKAPSPCLTPIGGGRAGNAEKRNINSPNSSFNGPTNESVDTVATALSSINLSNGVIEEDHKNYLFNPNSTNQHTFTKIHSDNYNGGFDLGSTSLQSEMQKTGILSNTSSYLKGTSNGGAAADLFSPYQHFDSPNSNYGMNGYPMSPISGHMGSSNYPPLFENAAAAAAMAAPVMLRGSSRSLMGNQMSGNASFVDPVYLPYLRTAEYADPSMDRNYMSNPYGDLLQKAYLGNLLSPQKSDYKTGVSSAHGYYGNPAFGIGLSYLGSPLANPMIPNSPVSPMRHGEYNMRFGGGMRNVSMGHPWHLENTDNNFASSLLEEFKSNKTKCFELAEIVGHVVEFSVDQYGSRFIQQKLETATPEEKNMVFQEIFPESLTLMTDVFGNYAIQKFFEHGMATQRRELANKLFGHVLTLSLQMYGCRVIQKAIEVVDVDQKIEMVVELDDHVMRCVRDQNGNHVIQKCIECVPEGKIQFIVSTFFDQVVTLATHPYGCRVIQRVLEHCEDENTQSKVMEEILGSVSMLAQDQYGNYVVQHVLEHGNPHERSTIIRELAGSIVQMSQQKFASNVVEKCLTFGDQNECQLLVSEMLGTTDENEPLQAMMKDQFANYVVQKVLETCSDEYRDLIMSRIKVHLNALKKYTYGKHIVARVEKLLTAGERRIAVQSQQPC